MNLIQTEVVTTRTFFTEQKEEAGNWDGSVTLLFANHEKMQLERNPAGSNLDDQNIKRNVAFPAPLIGLKFYGATKYLPVIKSLSIFLKEKNIMHANFHIETCWHEGLRFVDDQCLRIIFEKAVPIDGGMYLAANDGITGQYFWINVERCFTNGSPVRTVRFGFWSDRR